jgi:hypothetical protein
MTEVAEIVFTPEAGSFNITADGELSEGFATTLTISGAGITNNSGVRQNLTAGPGVKTEIGVIEFLNGATAGGGEISFFDNATAADASFTATGSDGRR